MTCEKLQCELEKLSQPDRIQRIVEFGGTTAALRRVAVVIAPLEQGAFYGRSLTLQPCYGTPCEAQK